jgi:periplasmic divalent cation tolerance protein
MMEKSYIVVLITTPSMEVGQKIADALIEQKLAACVNILPQIGSIFNWEGKTSQEEEILLIAKTRSDLFKDQFIPAVKSIHPYDVPEIIALPIVMGDQQYLNWIEAETKS